jgi:hypothetical protein
MRQGVRAVEYSWLSLLRRELPLVLGGLCVEGDALLAGWLLPFYGAASFGFCFHVRYSRFDYHEVVLMSS